MFEKIFQYKSYKETLICGDCTEAHFVIGFCEGCYNRMKYMMLELPDMNYVTRPAEEGGCNQTNVKKKKKV